MSAARTDEIEETATPPYGRSPAVDALNAVKALDELPMEIRAKVSAAFVRQRLLRRFEPRGVR